MRIFLILILTAGIFTNANSQDSLKIVGRWRVAIMDNGVRYDYKTGKYIVSKELQDSLNKWKEKSLFTLDDYITWAGSCSECYYIFKQDGTYQEFRETLLRSEGTFAVQPKDSLIKISIKMAGKTISKEYKYSFIEQRLILNVPSFYKKEGLTLELELSQ